MNEKIELIMEDLDENNISSILKKYKQIMEISKELKVTEEQFKTKIRNYLKERKWEQYKDDETQINVSITKLERRVIDTDVLKELLNESQFAQVYKTTTSERLNIITPERREALKKYVKQNKKNVR